MQKIWAAHSVFGYRCYFGYAYAIINLFVYSDMTLKEIAFAVGMKNVTHLNSLLQQHYGKTPSTLCREYRHSKYVKDLT